MPTLLPPTVPSALADWAARQVGPDARIAPAPGVHGRVQTWQVRRGGSRWFCRWGRAQRKHAQELRAAHAVWPHLPGAPSLVAADDRHGALLFTACPGAPADGGAPALAALGRTLAALHALPLTDDDPVPLADALPRRLAAAARALPAELAPLRARAERRFDRGLPGLARARRWCHRDVQPHNWLWDGRTLGLIDWEHARPDAPLVDLARLVDHPEAATLLRSYGPVDPEALSAAVALDTLAALAWATRHQDPTEAAAAVARLDATH